MWQTTGGSTRKQKKRHKTRENIRAWIERDREDDDDDDERYEERAQTSVCLLSTTARPPLMQNRLSSSILHPGRKTIRRKNKQAPGTKIGSGQELAARLRLNGGKQAEMREREREREKRPRQCVQARSRFCGCHRNSPVGASRGHEEGDGVGMLLVPTLNQDTS